MLPPINLVVDLVPHAEAIPRDSWHGDHDVRGLGSTGRRQSDSLAAALSGPVDAIFSSPSLRCRQTVEPLARASARDVINMSELRESNGFDEPAEWTAGIFAPMGDVIAGAWLAGRGTRALHIIADQVPTGRVVACSHGDLIPVLLAYLAEAYQRPLPEPVERGGWCRLGFHAGELSLMTHRAG